MNTRQKTAVCVFAFLAAAVLVAACAELQAPKPAEYPRAFLPIPPARVTIVPISQFMRVAALNFIDQTGAARQLTETLADMLSTELHKTGRFEVYDRGQLRMFDFAQVVDQCQKTGKGACGSVETAREKVVVGESGSVREYDLRTKYTLESMNQILGSTDAVLICAITSISGGRVSFDYRLVNSHSFTTMVSGVGSVSFEASGGAMRVARDDMVKIADAIKDALPTPMAGKLGKVTVQDGTVLTISLGRKDRILAGMNVFVVAPGRGQYQAADKLVDEMYLAQAYVVSVYDNTSQVVVFQGNDFRVGDDVRFK
jgi:curli biogenesis system outer membrane secretion channel CsgG